MKDIDHSCCYCGAPNAPYGFDSSLRDGRIPLWSCHEHQTEVMEMGQIRMDQRAQAAAAAARIAASSSNRSGKGQDRRQAGLFG